MASSQDIEKLKRSGRLTGETWEEAFKATEKNSEEFHKLVEEFTEFVRNWKEFSEVRRDRLADYIEDLDDVSTHWKDINQWIEENTDSTITYTGSLSEVKKLFQEISGELGGVRRQTIDNVNIVRSLSRLAGDNLIALRQEGGLTENVIRSLNRKSVRIQEEYKTRLGILGVLENESNIEEIRKKQESDLSDARAKVLQLERLQSLRLGLSQSQREELKNLRNEVQLRTSNLELLNEYNRSAAEGLYQRIDLTREQFRIQRRGLESTAGPNAFGASRVALTTKLMGKIGMSEEAGDISRNYGEWVSKRVDAKVNRDLTDKAKTEAQRNFDLARGDMSSEQFKARKGEFESKIEQYQKEIQEREARLTAIQSGIAGNKGNAENFVREFRPDKSIHGLRSNVTGRKASQEEIRTYEASIRAVDKLRVQEKQLTEEIKRKKALLDKTNVNYSQQLGDILKAESDLEDATSKATAAETEYNTVFSTKFKLLPQIGKALQGFLDPAKLVGFALTTLLPILLKVDDLASHLKQRIGSWETSLAAANLQFASAADWLQIATELTDNWHVNPITIFTGEEIGKMAEAKNLLGLTSEQAQALGIYAKINNKSSDDFMKSMNKGFQAYNQTHRTAIAYGNVQREVLKTSDAIRLSYGGQGEALAKAANAALEMGMTMQQLESVAQNLTQFQSSIEAEMQAQLLTGKQLNLAKARELALNNDLAGVANEIKKQGIDAAWWGQANRIQQENMARALGMSREEMAKMLVTQQLQNGASAKAIAANMKISEQEVKSMSASETWKKTVEKLAQAFAPIARILGVIADVVSLVVQPIASIIGYVISLGGLIDRLTESTSAWANVVRAVIGTLGAGLIIGRGWGFFTNLFKTIFGLVTGIGTGVRGLTAAMGPLLVRVKATGGGLKGWSAAIKQATLDAKAFNAASNTNMPKTWLGNKLAGNVRGKSGRWHSREVAERAARIRNTGQTPTAQVPPAAAQGPSKMGRAFRSLGKNMNSILKGAAAIAIMVAALWGFAKACQEFKSVNLEDLGLATAGMAVLVGAVVVLGKVATSFTKDILLGALAVTIIAGATWILGKALQTFEGIDINLIGLVIGGMVALTAATAVLGLAATVAGPWILLGVGAMVLMTGAVALLGLALRTFKDIDFDQINQLPKAMLSLAKAGLLALVAGPNLFAGAAMLIPAAELLTVGGLALALASIPFNLGVDKISRGFDRLAQITTTTTGISTTVQVLKALSNAVREISSEIDKLDLGKFKAFVNTLPRPSLVDRVVGLISNRKVKPQVEIPGETQEIPQENITKAAEEVTVKQAEAQANSQQISIEQKAADLSKIEKKMDELAKVIIGSRPDWNWLEFGTEMKRNTPWIG